VISRGHVATCPCIRYFDFSSRKETQAKKEVKEDLTGAAIDRVGGRFYFGFIMVAKSSTADSIL
jgi:hypothetical protein